MMTGLTLWRQVGDCFFSYMWRLVEDLPGVLVEDSFLNWLEVLMEDSFCNWPGVLVGDSFIS